MSIPVRVIVPTHPEDRQILDLHLQAHKLWSPPDLELVLAGMADGNYSAACNEAAQGHNGLLVFLNDTTIPGPSWFEDMYANYQTAIAETRPGLIGARSDAISGPQAITSGVLFDQLTPIPRIDTAAAVIHTEAFNDVGGFDEDFPSWFAEDALSLRVHESGCTNLIGNWYMRNYGRVSPRGFDPDEAATVYMPLLKQRYYKDDGGQP